MVREAFEEVGLVIEETDKLIQILADLCPGEVDYMVTTFWLSSKPVPDLSELKAEEGLTMGFLQPDILSDPISSPFADYNKKVMVEFERYLADYAND